MALPRGGPRPNLAGVFLLENIHGDPPKNEKWRDGCEAKQGTEREREDLRNDGMDTKLTV